MWPFEGRAVTVLRPVESSTDPFGAPVGGEPAEEPVDGVLVDEPTTEDIDSTTRRYGVSCDLTLHFPKAYHGSLRGCSVVLADPWPGTFEVMGDPLPYDPGLTPGEHDRKVHVRKVSG